MSGYPPEGAYRGTGEQPPEGSGYPPGGTYPPGPAYPPPGYAPPGYAPPGYAQGPPPKIRPGRVWYLLALALVVAGVVWLIVGLSSVVNSVNGLQRVPAPGQGTVNLTHSGGYTIYYEGPGAQSNSIPALHVTVTPASQGAAVAGLTSYGSNVTYSVNSHSGRAVLTLHVTKPGTFTVRAVGQRVTGADLAIGGGIGGGIVGTVVGSVLLVVVGVLGAIVLFVVRVVRRRSTRRGYA